MLGAMRNGLFIAALMLAIPFGAPADAQELPRSSSSQPVLLSADEISYNEDLGIVVATGSVEIAQGARVVLADRVTYNERENTVSAVGHVRLLEPGGEVVFAEYMELTDDMKNGVVRDLRILLTDNSRIAAAGGRLQGGERTEMRKAVFSPCELCEDDPEAAPLWQLKAVKVVHDQRSHDIEYTDAWMEMYGVPVFYTPYFSHPDPTVKRRSGILTPDFGNDSQLGMLLRLPYFVTLGDDKDATITPIFTTKERVALAVEYRQRFTDGEFVTDGSFTRVERRGSDGEQLGEDVNRGHIFGKGRFDIDRTYRWGFDAAYTTDDTYLRRYGFSSEDVLTNNPFVEGFRGRNYMHADGYYFMDLREDRDQDQVPIILPVANYNHVGEPDSIGGRWAVDANMLNLNRIEGADSRRLSLKLGWAAPYTSPWGDVWELSASVQNDAYWVDDVQVATRPAGTTESGLTGRFFPQAMLKWRYPFMRNAGTTRQIIEPVAALVVSPNGGNPSKIPNEDSRGFEFDDANLFSANRFAGLDRVDGGKRIVYGLGGGVYGDSGGQSTFFFGQSYRLRENDDTFDEGSGLYSQLSDYVGRVRTSPGDYLDLVYRFRLSRTDLGPIRNEVGMTAGPEWLQIQTSYLFFQQTETGSEFGTREEVFVSGRVQLTDYWSFRATHRRDLMTGGGALRTTTGMIYEDECFTFDANFSRSFFRDRDFEETDTVLFRLVFKHLGEIGTAVR